MSAPLRLSKTTIFGSADLSFNTPWAVIAPFGPIRAFTVRTMPRQALAAALEFRHANVAQLPTIVCHP
ncbi:hypothetical protein [Mesorhizobium sanjuanii]|uniref:hypothetical protein n=1 Tax=Mesorhizobium sanjuanii TaxID=2037900 RepID=UPI0013FDCEC2|nr:hypothetical protein [Mesorhizobium sanjuanii]